MLNLFNIALYVPLFHKSIQISLIIAESCKWSSNNLVGEPLKQWLGVWSSSRYTLSFHRLYHSMERVCCQHITTRTLEIPTMLKNNNNLIQCDISILLWEYRVSDQGHPCKKARISYKWATRHYLWRAYYKMVVILQTSGQFDCLWNQNSLS